MNESKDPNSSEDRKPAGNFWGFLSRAFDFFGKVLEALKGDRLLTILWGFAVLFLVILIVVLVLAGLPPEGNLAVVVLIVATLLFLFVYTVRRLPTSLDGDDKCTIDQTGQEETEPQRVEGESSAGSPVSASPGRPASLGAGFFGRKDDLQAVSSAFQGHRAVVISGGAGSGKSRLAAEHAHRANVDSFWTDGGADLASTLAGLAPVMGVDVAGKNDEELAGEVGGLLAGLPPETLWVVDNVSDMELVNALVNVSESVRLLITTRDSRPQLLPSTVAHHGVEVLKPDAANALLCSRSEFSADDPTVALIADKVGYLPLALEVLAVRLGELRQTPERVIEQLDQAPTVLQLETFQQALGASIPRAEGVFASVRGTLDDLEEQDRQALGGLAYVADATVPEALAAALMGLDDAGLTDLLARCSRQSVLSWAEGHVTIHALTVAVLAATNPDESFRIALGRAQARLRAINQDDPVAMRSELVHPRGDAFACTAATRGRRRVCTCYQNDLAIGYWSAGRNDEAIELDEQTLEVRERVLGCEHLDTLTSRSNLAVRYWTAGRNDEAIELDEQTLEVMERVLGPEHPDTLASRTNLAIGYATAGRNEEAMELDEQTLEVMERVLGPEHPDTLASRGNLAIGYAKAGRNDDAIELDEQTLEVRERVLGPEHPDTLASRGNLAIGYAKAGRNDEAIELDEQTLEVMERVLGPEHPDTLTNRSNLAIRYATAGRNDEAIELDEQTLEVRERVLGSEHPDTLTSRNNLAIRYRAAGRDDDAPRLETQD